MNPPVKFYLSRELSDPANDARRLQRFVDMLCDGLAGGISLGNLQVDPLTITFTTPQSSNLSISTKFTTRPFWVELVSFSRQLPTYAALSLGTEFRWTWDNGTITTDVFNGMPSDGNVYQVQLLAFLQ